MVHVSEVLNLPVVDAAGARIGRLHDLQVDSLRARVEALVVRGAGGLRRVEWPAVEALSPLGRRVTLATGARADLLGGNGDLLHVRRDLLDKQIIDIQGRRVVKVNDVLLAAEGPDLHVRQIEVGLAGAVRRLLAGVVPPAMVRRMAAGLSQKSIPWDYVGLVEQGSARIRLKVHQQLARMHPADLADILEDLGRVERSTVMSSLDPETAALALSEADPSVQASVVEAIRPDLAADLMEELQPDEAADILGEVSEEHSRKVLAAMDAEEAGDVRELLEFHEDSAGGLMTTDFFRARAEWTVERTLHELRQVDSDLLGELDEIPVVADDDVLVGVAPLVRIVRSAPTDPITHAMRREARAVTAEAPLREVAERFEKYSLRALTVVDEFGRLVGLISVEDVFRRLVAGT
jgi:flagellar motility protein MotE (MotC chaperone)